MYARILVHVDGSPTSEGRPQRSHSSVRMRGGRILLMHLVDELPYIRLRKIFRTPWMHGGG
jgi:hypothetical protein